MSALSMLFGNGPQTSDATGRTELEQQRYELQRLSATQNAWQEMMKRSMSGTRSLYEPNNVNVGVVKGWSLAQIEQRWRDTHRPGFSLLDALSRNFWGNGPIPVAPLNFQPPQALSYPYTQDNGLVSWWVVGKLSEAMAPRWARIAELTRVGTGAGRVFVPTASKGPALPPGRIITSTGPVPRTIGNRTSGTPSGDAAARGGVRIGGGSAVDMSRLAGGMGGNTSRVTLPAGRIVDGSQNPGAPATRDLGGLVGRLTGGGSPLSGRTAPPDFRGFDRLPIRSGGGSVPIEEPPEQRAGAPGYGQPEIGIDWPPVTTMPVPNPVILPEGPDNELAGPVASAELGNFIWANPAESARRIVATHAANEVRANATMDTWTAWIQAVWYPELEAATGDGEHPDALSYCLLTARPDATPATYEAFIRAVRDQALAAVNGGSIDPVPYTPSAPSSGGDDKTLLYVGVSLALGLLGVAMARRKRRKRR